MESGLQHTVEIVQAVCRLAGSGSLVDEIRVDLQEDGIITAVEQHDAAAIFDWLAAGLSF